MDRLVGGAKGTPRLRITNLLNETMTNGVLRVSSGAVAIGQFSINVVGGGSSPPTPIEDLLVVLADPASQLRAFAGN